MFSVSIHTSIWICGQVETERIQIYRVTGDPIVGVITKMEKDGSIQLQDGTSFAGKSILRWQKIGSLQPRWPQGSQVIFTNGDRLVGKIVDGGERFIQLRLDAPIGYRVGEQIRIPLSRLSRMTFEKSNRNFDPISENEPRKRDILTLRNRDRLTGSYGGMAEEGKKIRFDADNKSLLIEVAKVASIDFNSELASSRKVEKPYFQLILSNGSRISLLEIANQNRQISGQTLFKHPFSVRWDEIVGIHYFNEASISLMELTPLNYRYTPYLNESYTWTANRNLNGNQLSLREKEGIQYFDRGISMHARSSLTFSLKGKYRRFDSLVGLDPELGAKGDVQIQILLDGKQQKQLVPPKVNLESRSFEIRLGVENVQEMSLIVDWAEGGNVGDVVNWCDPRLILK
jgi:hypothetical protein